ncbi:1-hydroxycarotenoid 3,4-desaturase CrtD [Methyloversatilis thermotolerans]|uniref:1-hydroxycarotenoid 3,4-desaturase CrtD n=1 Tax=Methyloversatilis thermotolerans TaxID=1346290 RepID=UPI0003807351|nr:1-hydroxycarotenoid 3,4-desaturase CrtD [Methyloversatilis thermotolerans]
MNSQRIAVIGAGMAGLVAALELACRGLQVTLLERADTPGGKLRELEIDGRRLDAGPTVLTLREVFDEVFARAGSTLAQHVMLRPLDVLARHAWADGGVLDLHADAGRSADAIGRFAGAAEARGFIAFTRDAARIHRTLDASFMRAQRPDPLTLSLRAGVSILGIRPFSTLWSSLCGYFRDHRLRQLFGRYATYCGSSPFEAPATLMLVAHVEQRGVWTVDGGLHALARALATLCAQRGVTLRYGSHVERIALRAGRVTGIELAGGETLPCDAVVLNGDVSALAAGCFGDAVRRAAPADGPPPARSLSALTCNLVAETHGFPLHRHNVFFSSDYAAEFNDLMQHHRLPRRPTVYICAQDRPDGDGEHGERLFCLVNAPADAGRASADDAAVHRCARAARALLARCGLRIDLDPARCQVTTPRDFDRLFPASAGALYGAASHGWRAAFRRPGARSRVPGLYLAGGSVHPGPGLPMAALSGQLAAACLLDDIGRKT